MRQTEIASENHNLIESDWKNLEAAGLASMAESRRVYHPGKQVDEENSQDSSYSDSDGEEQKHE